jgi:hypothetical protein
MKTTDDTDCTDGIRRARGPGWLMGLVLGVVLMVGLGATVWTGYRSTTTLGTNYVALIRYDRGTSGVINAIHPTNFLTGLIALPNWPASGGTGEVSTAQLNGASNAVVAIVIANDTTTSNGLVALLTQYDTTTSNALRTAFLAADITTSNGVVTLLQANDITTSNGVISVLVANDTTTSNALRTAYLAADITTSNGVLTASFANDMTLSNTLYALIQAGSGDGGVHSSQFARVPVRLLGNNVVPAVGTNGFTLVTNGSTYLTLVGGTNGAGLRGIIGNSSASAITVTSSPAIFDPNVNSNVTFFTIPAGSTQAWELSYTTNLVPSGVWYFMSRNIPELEINFFGPFAVGTNGLQVSVTNTAQPASQTLTNLAGTGAVTNRYDVSTNLFTGTTFGLGTNATIVCSSNIYITDLVNVPSGSVSRWGQLTIVASGGDVTVTNLGALKMSDMATSRVLTNGNSMCIAVEVQAGVFTNGAIVQFK